MVLAAACEVRTEVLIQVDEDGSGQVVVTARLDAEAARRLGDPATALRTDDLTAAGWTVDDPALADDGALTLRAVRDVTGPDQFASALAEVGGNGGVFRDVRLETESGFASTSYEFGAQVELTGNLDQFGDGALTEVLEGLPLARTPEELELEGADDPGSMTLAVVVSLPGGDLATDGEVRDGDAVWTYPVTGAEPTSASLLAVSSTTQNGPRLLLGAGVLLVIVAMGLGAVGVVRRRG